MITIFCDFRQFCAKKLAFFLKTNPNDPLFAECSSVWRKKRQFFSPIILAKIFLKIITSVPGQRRAHPDRRRNFDFASKFAGTKSSQHSVRLHSVDCSKPPKNSR
jgi:hypothetical protein